ncbi:MAG: ATP-binding protein [Ignavibacteria bacterium]|nr:ATP-binding protein [Ignavibacteria bacterium]
MKIKFSVVCIFVLMQMVFAGEIDSLRQIVTRHSYEERMSAYLRLIYLLRHDDPLSSLSYFDIASQEAEKNNDILNKYRLYFFSAMTYTDFGLLNKGLEQYHNCLELENRIPKEKSRLSSILNNTAIIYQTLQNYDSALVMLNRSLGIAEEKQKTMILANIGEVYLHTEDYQNAIMALQNSLIYGETPYSAPYASIARLDLADAYIRLGKKDSAELYLDGNKLSYSGYYKTYIRQKFFLLKASQNLLKGNLSAALNYSDSCLSMLKFEKSTEIGKSLYLLRQKIYMKMGNITAAERELQQYDKLVDEVLQRDYIKNMSAINQRYEQEKKQYRDKVYELAEARRKIYILFIAAIIIGGLFLFLVYRYSEKRKKTKLLLSKNRELSSLNNRFTGFLEQATEGFLLTDQNGGILIWNNALASITGVPKERSISYDVIEVLRNAVLHSESLDNTSVKLVDVLQELLPERSFEPKKICYDTRFAFTPDPRFLEMEMFPIRSDEEYYFGAVIRDITDAKKTEAELMIAKENAEKSDKLKTEFLSQMSHEIRTPVNIILSYSEILSEELKERLQNEDLVGFSSIQRAAKRLMRTVELILNMSALQAGAYKLTPKEMDLYENIIKKLYAIYYPICKNHGLDLEIVNHTPETRLVIDEYSVFQIADNLINNAVKYTPKGAIRIHLGRDEEDNLFFEVSDTGVGISENYLDRIFTPFAQEDQGYSRRFEGNGLGLALSSKYCELNNARISVSSEKNSGSVFRVTFLNHYLASTN